MPQLFSRMDDMNWLTPSIADILSQGAAPPGGDGTIREHLLSLQKRMGELESPIRIINVRPTPSYTLFIAKPEVVGRLGNRRTISHGEIKRSLGQIAEEQRGWKLGFMPQIQDNPDTVGILLRTDEHRPLSLRRLLVRSTFRDNPSTLTLALGNTLEQRLVLFDLASTGNLLIVGAEGGKSHLIHSALLTLMSLNTPSELRLAIIGTSSMTFKSMTSTPHALGRVLDSPGDGVRLITGLIREIQRRMNAFQDANAQNIAQYNEMMREQGKSITPRIVIILDSMTDEAWQEARDEWNTPLAEIIKNRGKAGVHLIITSNGLNPPELPSAIAPEFPVKVLLRNVANDHVDRIPNFHTSLLRFIDALVLDEDVNLTPIEMCAITPEEIKNTVSYWQQAIHQRQREAENQPVSATTGVTGILQSQQPQPPAETAPTSQTQDKIALPDILQQAQALAAYLGWLGVGPLQDILGMSPDEARRTLTALRSEGILENDDSLTPRFIVFTDAANDEASEVK